MFKGGTLNSNKVTKIFIKIKGGNVVDSPKDKKCIILIFQCIRLIEKIGEFSINDLKVRHVDFLGGTNLLSTTIIK